MLNADSESGRRRAADGPRRVCASWMRKRACVFSGGVAIEQLTGVDTGVRCSLSRGAAGKVIGRVGYCALRVAGVGRGWVRA